MPSNSRSAYFALGVAAPLAVLAVVLVGYAVGTADDVGTFLGTAATSSAIAVAALATGSLLGFLFGIPRVLADPSVGDGAQGRSNRYNPNTNLEQVSDWLTKILLGASLVSLTQIAASMGRLFDRIGNTLGGGDATVFAGGLVIYAGIVGFCMGWLWARIVLTTIMVRADRANARLDEAEAADDPVEAEALRAEAFRLAETPLAALRTEPSPDAAVKSDALVSQVRRIARTSELTRDAVRPLVASANPKDAVVAIAMMQGQPDLVDVEWLAQRVQQPTSAFEQYQALVAAKAALEAPAVLTDDQRRVLVQAVEAAGEDIHVRLSTDRRRVVREIKEGLKRQPQPA